jgi:hypothetical protein
MWFFDDWHDFLRVGIFLLSLWCMWTLILRKRQYGDDWTTKTLDYWYAMLMWTFVGVVTGIQGVYLDRPPSPALAAVTAAVLVTGNGLRKKGAWGGTDA